MCSPSAMSIHQRSKELNCVVLQEGSSCTEVVLNSIPAFPEHFNPSCHCAVWQCCITTCFMQTLKMFFVLQSCATSILMQESCSSFVNTVLGCSCYPYESQRSTNCRVLSPLAALTHLTVLVHVHSSRTHHRHVTAALPVLFIQPLYMINIERKIRVYAGI